MASGKPKLVRSYWVHLDGSTVEERVIGVGGTGIIIQQGQLALKKPNISRELEVDGVPVPKGRLTSQEGDCDVRPGLIRSIQDEKAIYRRLGDHSGILRCYDISSPQHSVQMTLMENGDPRHYLAHTRPERKQQLSWLSQTAHSMAYVHHRRIIIGDIRLANLLLDDDLSVKLADFGNSTWMPLEWDLDGSDDYDNSILTDLGEFGAVMFQVLTGEKCRFDTMHDSKEPGDPVSWPPRDILPSTSGIWLGGIVEKCWTQGYKSAGELAAELDKEAAS